MIKLPRIACPAQGLNIRAKITSALRQGDDMVDRKLFGLAATRAFESLRRLDLSQFIGREMHRDSVLPGAGPGFCRLRPLRVSLAIGFRIRQAISAQNIRREPHGVPATFLRTEAIFLRLLVRVKFLVANLANAILNAGNLPIAFTRAIFISLLGDWVDPGFPANGTGAGLGSGQVRTLAGAIYPLALGNPGRIADKRLFAFGTAF